MQLGRASGQDRRARRRFIRSPIRKSHAVFTVAARRPGNNAFGCPHHKHDALATVVGLPQAEQTFARRIDVVFLETAAPDRDIPQTR